MYTSFVLWETKVMLFMLPMLGAYCSLSDFKPKPSPQKPL